MAVPYHTHTFEIPTATREDIEAGTANNLAVTPGVLGTAAIADRDDFATRVQGNKADAALPRNEAGALATKDKVNIADINASGTSGSDTYLRGDGTWSTPVGNGNGNGGGNVPATRRIIASNGLAGGGDLLADRTISLSEQAQASLVKAERAVPATRRFYVMDGLIGMGGEHGPTEYDLSSDFGVGLSLDIKHSLDLAETAFQRIDAGLLAGKDKVDIADINAIGTPDANSVLGGNGEWKSITPNPAKLAYEVWNTDIPINGKIWKKPESVTALIVQIQGAGGHSAIIEGKAYAGGGGGYVEVYLNNPPDQLLLIILPLVVGFYMDSSDGAFAYPGGRPKETGNFISHGLGGITRINKNTFDMSIVKLNGQGGYRSGDGVAIGGNAGSGVPCVNANAYTGDPAGINEINNYGAGGDAMVSMDEFQTGTYAREGGKGYLKFIYIY